jgi:membrane associated rhomboid family serine protease
MNFGNQQHHQPANPGNEILAFIKRKDVLSVLIKINVAIYLLINIVQVFVKLTGNVPDAFTELFVMPYLGAPSALNQLLLFPWTLLTYMFTHIDFLHVLFNMIWLFWMGKIFLEYLDKKYLIRIYLFGGLAGYLLYALAFNLFPGFASVVNVSRVIGASASVMAIMAAIAFYVPNYTINLLFFGRVKLIVMALIMLVIDFLMISKDNAGGHLAHLGGALFGYLFITAYKNGLRLSSFQDFLKPKPKFRNVYRNTKPVNDEDYNRNKVVNQAIIDSILDKISKSGYQSLSSQEKEILFKSSKKN